MKRLRRSYRQANGNQYVGPSDLIQAMDSECPCWRNGKIRGGIPLLEQIIDQADDYTVYTATVDDLAFFESVLRASGAVSMSTDPKLTDDHECVI